SNPHRGYITIIEGCDKFCAYCVVPYTRGKERSRTSDSVLGEARRMADAGFSEIQLLGQNVNSYLDPSGKKSFADLLAAVGQVAGIRRVRFTTSHPRDFTRDIVDAIDAVPTLCDHVHLPVQSGSSNTLRRMLRLYTRAEYLERIAWIKSARRRISLTTDIIVGFPGETAHDFEETITLLDEVRYDSLFAFKYSPRPNTPALDYPDTISAMTPPASSPIELGAYYRVRVTATHPNSLAGELADPQPTARPRKARVDAGDPAASSPAATDLVQIGLGN